MFCRGDMHFEFFFCAEVYFCGTTFAVFEKPWETSILKKKHLL